MIELLNRYFVPVYSSNEYAGDHGKGPREEILARQRIYHEFAAAGLPVGDVHVYILTPDGHPLGGLDAGSAQDPQKMIASLERYIAQLKLQPGPPVVQPAAQSAPVPADGSGALVLHLVARGSGHGEWRQFPAENWIVLDSEESRGFLGPDAPKPGDNWEISRKLSTRLLTKFYPQTEDTSSAERNRIDSQSLRATVVSCDSEMCRARLDGSLRMKRTFYPNKEDNNFVNAVLLGYMEFEPGTRRIQKLRLATRKATYGEEEFSAALRSLPPEAAARHR